MNGKCTVKKIYFCWFLAGRALTKTRYHRVTLEYRTMALLTFSTALSSLLPLPPLHPLPTHSLKLHITTTAHRDNPSVTIPLCSIQHNIHCMFSVLNCKQVLVTVLNRVSKSFCRNILVILGLKETQNQH